MIFKRLFRPEWKHTEPEKRLKAIDDLSLDNVEHKGVLRELAFNDEVRRVRLKALEKLNDLSFWWLAYRQDRDDSNRAKCKQQILALFATTDLSEAKKNEFCEECPDNNLLSELYGALPEPDIRKMVVAKLNKQEMFANVVEKDANEALKLWALDHIEDDKSLRRLGRKSLPESIKLRIQNILQQREELKLKPKQVEQQATLLISQLNALADKMSEPKASEQPELAERVAKLKAQWQTLEAELSWHPHKEQAEEKYSEISKRVDIRLEKLEQGWQAEREKTQLAKQKQDNADVLSADLNRLHKALTNAFTAEETPNFDSLQRELTELRQALSNQALESDSKALLSQKLEECDALLSSLLDYPTRLEEATAAIAELKKLNAADDDAHVVFTRWSKGWNRFVELPLPTEMQKEVSALLTDWEHAAAKARKQSQANEKECRRLLGVVNRSLQSGHYKRAIRLFHKATALLQTLPMKAQHSLASQIERLSKRVAELEDWHEYIAQPKISDLLAEIQTLAESPLPDPEQQSAAVKDLRQRWQQLIVDASQDHVEEQRLFDEASEKAFASCREHYAEKQVARQKNMQQCETICAQLEALHASLEDSEVVFSELESAFRKLTREWQKVGEVDFKQRPAIRSRYRSATAPIVDKLNGIYAQNAQQKRDLIDKAKTLKEELHENAGRTFAILMTEWKQIGYAGKQDRALWQHFSGIGNDLREKQRADRADQIAAWQASADQAQRIIDELRETVKVPGSIETIKEAVTQAKSSFSGVEGLGPRDRKQLGAALEQAISTAEDQIKSQHAENQRKQWTQTLAVIDVLLKQEIAGEDLFDWQEKVDATALQKGTVQKLGNLFGKPRIQAQPEVLKQRDSLLLTLEIIAGVDSPKEHNEARNQRQVEMLSERMQGGSQQQPKELFWRWLAISRLSAKDEPLVERLMRVAHQL